MSWVEFLQLQEEGLYFEDLFLLLDHKKIPEMTSKLKTETRRIVNSSEAEVTSKWPKKNKFDTHAGRNQP